MASSGLRLFAILILGASLSLPAFGQWTDGHIIWLEAGGQRFTAELALTPHAHARGLMYRQRLPAEHGMLFVFTRPERLCMWMKDTPLALSVAFLDARGVIINIADMQPLSLDPHCAKRPARYALEMPRGWFGRRGLVPGMRINSLEHFLPGG